MLRTIASVLCGRDQPDAHVRLNGDVDRQDRLPVLDKITKLCVFVVAQGRFEQKGRLAATSRDCEIIERLTSGISGAPRFARPADRTPRPSGASRLARAGGRTFPRQFCASHPRVCANARIVDRAQGTWKLLFFRSRHSRLSPARRLPKPQLQTHCVGALGLDGRKLDIISSRNSVLVKLQLLHCFAKSEKIVCSVFRAARFILVSAKSLCLRHIGTWKTTRSRSNLNLTQTSFICPSGETVSTRETTILKSLIQPLA